MSCEVKLLSTVEDLAEVQEQFGLSSEESWLNAVCYSLSPAGDVLAFGHGSILVVLTSKWDRERQLSVYKIAWKGAIDDPNCLITSVLCAPIVDQENSQTIIDFNYIVVGLNSGDVLFYGENGTLIHSQVFQQEAILSIKIQRWRHIREEVFVYYASCVVIIQCSHLFPFLRVLKQQIGRYGLGSPRVNETQQVIPCRKWSYEKSMTVQDGVYLGPQGPSTFDYLVETSLEDGFFARYRNSTPQTALFVAVGTKPYIGFHYSYDGFTHPALADVARAVASKIKSALPTWFGGSSTPPAPQQPQLQSPDPLVCRYGLCDVQRNAYSVWLAPDFKHAAVADNLGRVILVDCLKGIALRMWKGYRDAQCGFIRVTESASKDVTLDTPDRRKAMFLVIFAPRRSILEIWSLKNGPKVATFSAARNGQLIYNVQSFMAAHSGSSKVKYSGNGCIFLDPTDCSLKEIYVPFHCALSDSSSKPAKDLHLLKKLKMCLKAADGSESEQLEGALEICRGFETDDIKLQCLETLVKYKKTKAVLFRRIVEIFGKFDESEDEHETEEDEKKALIRQLCENYRKITMFYLFLTGEVEESELAQSENITSSEVDVIPSKCPEETNTDEPAETTDELPKTTDEPMESPDEPMESPDEPSKITDDSLKNTSKDIVDEDVQLTEIELTSISKLMEVSNMKSATDGPPTAHVTFDESTAKPNTFSEYLSYINVSQKGLILLKDDKPNVYSALGKIVFESIYQSNATRLDGFVTAAALSGFTPEALLKVFIAYWLRIPCAYRDIEELIKDLNEFSKVLRRLCFLADDKVRFDNNSICVWWQDIREDLLYSPSPLRGYLVAIMCRNEGLKYEESSVNEEYQFEEVSQEACQWTLIIGKLEEVAVLGAVLSASLQSSCVVHPCLIYQKPDLNLIEIFKGGLGIISELVAKWIAASGIDPEKLVIEVPDEAVESDHSDSPEPETSPKKQRKRIQMIKQDLLETSEYGVSSESEPDPVLYNFIFLRRHFPFSLENGTILCHLAWEYIGHWSKNMSDIKCLTAGIACLRAIPRLQYSMKHGLCCMIWNAHLKIPMEATTKLVNKVGRLPTENLCLQDIGISDALVPQYLERCIEFFEQFSQTIDHDKLELRFDELVIQGPVPLTALAIEQKSANLTVIKLLYELSSVLLILTSFNVKYKKPINQLFVRMACMSFFKEINRPLDYAIPKSDVIMQNVRLESLCLTITCTMDLIRQDMQNVFYNDHLLWMERIRKLADVWEISAHELEKHQIVELYAHGWDTYAEELLVRIAPDMKLGELLLAIAARRLIIYSNKSNRIYCRTISIGSSLTNYLNNLTENESYGPALRLAEGNEAVDAAGEICLEKLTKLAWRTYVCLRDAKDRKGEYVPASLRVAGTLHDACNCLKVMDE